MAVTKSPFFTYKGIPLVRKGNTIYFGNMYDEFIVEITILGTEKIGDLDIANKVRLRKMATNTTLPVKKSETNSLYEALDMACAWLRV